MIMCTQNKEVWWYWQQLEANLTPFRLLFTYSNTVCAPRLFESGGSWQMQRCCTCCIVYRWLHLEMHIVSQGFDIPIHRTENSFYFHLVSCFELKKSVYVHHTAFPWMVVSVNGLSSETHTPVYSKEITGFQKTFWKNNSTLSYKQAI